MGARNQWSAKTMHRSKKYTLGYFVDKQSAVDAYMMAVRAKSNGTIDSHLETIGAKATVGSRGPNKPKEGMLHLQTRDLVLDEHYFPDGRKRKRRRKYTGPLPSGIRKQIFVSPPPPPQSVKRQRLERLIQIKSEVKQEPGIKRELGEFAPDHKALLDDLKPRSVVKKLARAEYIQPQRPNPLPVFRGNPYAQGAANSFKHLRNNGLKSMTIHADGVRMDMDKMPKLESPSERELKSG